MADSEVRRRRLLVADTNVLISGLGWSGPPAMLVDASLDGRLTLVSSPALLDELDRVLRYPRIASHLPIAAGPITRVSVTTSVGAWFKDTNPTGAITGRDLILAASTTSNEFNLTATITNGYSEQLESAPVFAICKDQDGNINAAGSSQVDILPAKGETGKTLRMYGPMPASPSSCQVAGTPASPMQGG